MPNLQITCSNKTTKQLPFSVTVTMISNAASHSNNRCNIREIKSRRKKKLSSSSRCLRRSITQAVGLLLYQITELNAPWTPRCPGTGAVLQGTIVTSQLRPALRDWPSLADLPIPIIRLLLLLLLCTAAPTRPRIMRSALRPRK